MKTIALRQPVLETAERFGAGNVTRLPVVDQAVVVRALYDLADALNAAPSGSREATLIARKLATLCDLSADREILHHAVRYLATEDVLPIEGPAVDDV